MPGNQPNDDDDAPDGITCPICRAFYNGEVDSTVWKYCAVISRHHRPPEKIAARSRKQFDLDVDAHDVAHHFHMNHSERRSFA